MKKLLLITCAGIFALFVTGCATNTKMAFENDAERVSEKTKPIVLMKVTLKNEYRPNFQPKLNLVHVDSPTSKEALSRKDFVVDDKGREESGDVATGNSYFLRMELDPGQHEIRGLFSRYVAFPLLVGTFFTPMYSPIELKGAGIYYIGHVEATVREAGSKEFRAGPFIPLIDQAVTGASGGTFDVKVSDTSATDFTQFRAKFPALKEAVISKQILAPADRALAQQRWEKP